MPLAPSVPDQVSTACWPDWMDAGLTVKEGLRAGGGAAVFSLMVIGGVKSAVLPVASRMVSMALNLVDGVLGMVRAGAGGGAVGIVTGNEVDVGFENSDGAVVDPALVIAGGGPVGGIIGAAGGKRHTHAVGMGGGMPHLNQGGEGIEVIDRIIGGAGADRFIAHLVAVGAGGIGVGGRQHGGIERIQGVAGGEGVRVGDVEDLG